MTWSFRNVFYNSKGKKASDIGLFSGDRRRGTVSYLDQIPVTSSILGLGASSLWSLHLWSQASSFSSLWNLPLPSSYKGNLWGHLGPPGRAKIIAPSQNFTLITPTETLFPYIKGCLQIPDIRTWYLWRPLFCLRTICALTLPVMSLRGKALEEVEPHQEVLMARFRGVRGQCCVEETENIKARGNLAAREWMEFGKRWEKAFPTDSLGRGWAEMSGRHEGHEGEAGEYREQWGPVWS